MENFLALFFTYLEAPDAVPIWMSKYSNSDVKELSRITQEGGLPKTFCLEPSVNLLRISELVLFDLRDLKIKEITGLDSYTFSASFCTILNHILSEYNKDSLHDEYNSIKHGYRANGNIGEFRVAPMGEDKNSKPDDSAFSTLIGSPSGVSFPQTEEIGKKGGVRELGLQRIHSTINIEKHFERISQILSLSHLILILLKVKNGIGANIPKIALALPLNARKCWLPDEYEGVLKEIFKYNIQTLGQETRVWGFNVQATRMQGGNYSYYAFSTSHSDLMMWHAILKSHIDFLLIWKPFTGISILEHVDEKLAQIYIYNMLSSFRGLRIA